MGRDGRRSLSKKDIAKYNYQTKESRSTIFIGRS